MGSFRLNAALVASVCALSQGVAVDSASADTQAAPNAAQVSAAVKKNPTCV